MVGLLTIPVEDRENNIMNTAKKNTVALALGAVVISSASLVTTTAQANPFEFQELVTGYQIDATEGKCGEGKCGGHAKSKDAKAKAEGKCGEGKCGGHAKTKDAKAKAEGKCGEGKCGGHAKMKDSKTKKEGKCGEGKCGGSH